MGKSLLKSIVWLIVLAVASILYFEFIAILVPGNARLLINGVFVPVAIGIGGYLLLTGPAFARIALLCLIPVVHLMYFESDPAKPGLEMVFFYVEEAAIVIGGIVGLLVKRFLLSKSVPSIPPT
jgi:hypothetical protein